MNRRIVLADDEPDLRKLLRARLVHKGFEVFEADNGTTALDLVRRHRPDAVILDCKMPGMNGGEVCGHIKADVELRDIPVILVTATSQTIDDEPNPQMSADDILIKPFEFTDFYRRLNRLLRQPSPEGTP